MNIAFVTGSYPDMPCGVGDHVSRLASSLLRRGHRVRVITSRDSRVRPSDETLPVVTSWGRGCAREIARHFGDAQLLHFHTPTQGYGRSLAARRIPAWWALRVPVVSTVHEYLNLHWLHRWATRSALRYSRALIVTGEEDALILQKRWGNVTHIPAGANILPSGTGGPRDPRRICFFGMIYPGKGTRLLLQAKRLLEGIPLTVIGQVHPGYGDMYEDLRREAGDSVTWTGRLEAEEVSRLLSTCAVCVLPYEEGASLRRTSLVSALAHGTPVVTTRPRHPIPGLEEATCLLDRPDAVMLADTVRRLLADDSLRGRMSQAALRLAGSLSWDVIAQRTEEVYHRCLSGTTSG